jgi:hypothetical protein
MPTRAELRKAAQTTPMSEILGAQVDKALTPKQRAFARKVAEGKTKASAYREAYKASPSPRTIVAEPYRLAADPRIAAEIKAYALAIESAKQRTPAALRELVIHGLVQVALDPEAKNAERIAALKTLGTVTEVAAFTERRETRTISSSEDARKSVMAELTRLMGSAGSVDDARVISTEADELLRELAGTHPTGSPPDAEPESRLSTHTIPHERSDKVINPSEPANFFSDNFSTPGESDNFLAETPPPQSGDTPR